VGQARSDDQAVDRAAGRLLNNDYLRSPMAQIKELVEKIKELEGEIEIEFQKKREDIHFFVEKKRIRFSEEVAGEQRFFKTGLFRYIRDARPLVILNTS
jgi:hypothetical protein